MLKRISIGIAVVLFVISTGFVLWQGSFNKGSYPRPEDSSQALVFFGLSILIFLLMMGLGFYFARLIIKLWIARQTGGAGSRIRTRLVMGALALTVMPVFFMVIFNDYVLSKTLAGWFTQPTEHIKIDFKAIGDALDKQTGGRALAEARLIAQSPEAVAYLNGSTVDPAWLASFCKENSLLEARILPQNSMVPVASYGQMPKATNGTAMAPVRRDNVTIGTVYVAQEPYDLIAAEKQIHDDVAAIQPTTSQRNVRTNLLQVLTLIALFILVFGTWFAQYLARQITTPIAALLQAAGEVSKGNLGYRVPAVGIDELAELVGGFNRMTADLEANRSELDSRRRFTEAILESIPTGVIS